MAASLYRTLSAAVPRPIKRPVLRLLGLVRGKYGSYMAFWRARSRAEGGRLNNSHYRPLMLAMADEADEAFLAGKVVADFGCGPRGSLAWLNGTAVNIGIDVMVAPYADAFPDDIRSHGMIYVQATERIIPMPSASVDVMYSVNALDHCSDLQAMCDEIVRVLKPGGELIASFNLYEPPTANEPQCLTEELLDEALLRHFKPTSVRFGRHATPRTYEEMYSGRSTYRKGEKGYMWFRGVKAEDQRGG